MGFHNQKEQPQGVTIASLAERIGTIAADFTMSSRGILIAIPCKNGHRFASDTMFS